MEKAINPVDLDIEQGAGIFKALGDENRLRIILALSGRELYVCQIVNLLELSPSTVSRHLQILKEAGLINYQKDGRWIRYRYSTKATAVYIQSLLQPILELISDCEAGTADKEKLNQLLQVDPGVLCQKMNRC